MLPFKNRIQTFEISGSQIKAVLGYFQENNYCYVSGLRQTLKAKEMFWEVLSTTWADGTEIED